MRLLTVASISERPIRNPKSAIRNFRLVGEDRIELSPRVPRTRMLALHHTPNESGFRISEFEEVVESKG